MSQLHFHILWNVRLVLCGMSIDDVPRRRVCMQLPILGQS